MERTSKFMLTSLANCHSKILKFSTQRKFGTLTNSKTYNFTDPRPYFKSSKKPTTISFSQRKKTYSLNPEENADQPKSSPQIVSSKKTNFAS